VRPREEGYQLHEQAPSEPARPSRGEELPWPRLADDGLTPLGVDLTQKHLDVLKLIRKHVRIEGLDADDLLQEIYAAIWRKNHSASAWDPHRASFGKYVILVGQSIAGHMLEARRWRSESTGEEPTDDADERDPIQAFELAQELGLTAVQLEEHIEQVGESAKARKRAARRPQPGRLKPPARAALVDLVAQLRAELEAAKSTTAARDQAPRSAEFSPTLAAVEVAPADLPAVLATPPAGATRYRNEGQRLLRVAVEIHGRAEVARSAGVVVGSIAQWLGGLFRPGPASRPLLLAAYAIPVDVWDLDPLLAHDTAPPAALSHVELVAQLRASLLAHELADVAPAVPEEVLEEPSAEASPPAPIRHSRLRGAVSFYFNDLAAAAVGPLAGYDPFAARASSCDAGYC
jgi:DNA-directed RNA polymerase specialized sigma24 family protein